MSISQRLYESASPFKIITNQNINYKSKQDFKIENFI
jgi:hypothetical protein